MLEMLPEAVIVTDAEGAISTINAAAESLLGARPEEASGRPIASLLRGTGRDGEPLAGMVAREGAWTEAVDLESGIRVEISVAPVSAGDPDSGRVWLVRDARGGADFERLTEQWLANLSHELRTPLTGVKGYAGLLQKREVPEEKTRAFAQAIFEASEQLERVVDVLVTSAAIDAGRVDPPSEDVGVAAVVADVCERWRPRLRSHTLVEEAAAGQARVKAAPRLLALAIDQLVDNAVKFSPDGGPVTVRVTASGPSVNVAVADRGVGIAEADLSRIFRRFSQLDGSSTRSYGGLGLGLALVDRVARLYGGRVSAASTQGSGTAVTLSLPVAPRRAARDRRRHLVHA